jgi:hypothetical protein
MLASIYYSFISDIMCVVDEQGKIYKYIGIEKSHECYEFFSLLYPIEEWYESKKHPKDTPGFEFIGKF